MMTEKLAEASLQAIDSGVLVEGVLSSESSNPDRPTPEGARPCRPATEDLDR